MENEEINFDEFIAASSDEGYQTGNEEAEVTGEATETGNAESEGESSQQSGEEPENEEQDGSEETGAEGGEKPDSGTEQKFTLKVNKEEKEVSLEEMTALAQKGADYDRIKERDAKSQQTIQDLQAKIDGFTAKQGVLDVLDIIAQKSGSSLEQLAESLYINFRKSGGASEDAAREELKSAKLEKELGALKSQQTKQQEKANEEESRAKREMEQFRSEYPDVELTEELVDKLVPDVQKGMTLSAAYRKLEKAQEAEKIAELERKLAAKQQNAKNRRSSPGSQQDSGGSRSKDPFDEFMAAFA
ncbi:MAG: hypothetical protein MR636_09410 [Clostridiales bacterium]|nr:hypothetical protein [Clostridiales bacterium]